MKIFHALRRKLLFGERHAFPAAAGAGTLLLPSFAVEMRLSPRNDRVTIGTNSVVGCRIILEREVGDVHMGDDTYIGKSTNIICAQHISIGSNVLISWGCTLIDHDSHSIRWQERMDDVRRWREGLTQSIAGAAELKDWSLVPTEPIRIGDKSWIGFNAIVLKGVTIGEGAVVGAGSVVTKDVPAWTVVAGNPARVIRELANDER